MAWLLLWFYHPESLKNPCRDWASLFVRGIIFSLRVFKLRTFINRFAQPVKNDFITAISIQHTATFRTYHYLKMWINMKAFFKHVCFLLTVILLLLPCFSCRKLNPYGRVCKKSRMQEKRWKSSFVVPWREWSQILNGRTWRKASKDDI